MSQWYQGLGEGNWGGGLWGRWSICKGIPFGIPGFRFPSEHAKSKKKSQKFPNSPLYDNRMG